MPKKPNKIYKNTLVEYSWLVLAIVYECLRLYDQTKELDIAITDALLSVFLGLQFHKRHPSAVWAAGCISGPATSHMACLTA
jgi:hypothetical protein